jgi:glycosyltransferase involved in cell wall biosynthesis
LKTKLAFFVIDHASVGGVERVTANLINLFINNAIDVSHLFSLGDEKARNTIVDYHNDVTITCLDRNKLTEDLLHTIQKEKITHLIFQGDNMSISLDILKINKQSNCKTILHYHGSPFAYLTKNLYRDDIIENPINIFKIAFSKIVYPFKKRKLLKVIKSSKYGFITVSNSVKDELFKIYDNEFENIKCIHNPISVKQNKLINLNKKENKIVFISRLERKHKNAFMTLKIGRLLKKNNPNWELLILGDGPLFSKMKRYIYEYKLQNIQLLGEVKNVESYLEKSAIAISTSDSEGFGMGLFEAASFGNALITTKSHGGIKDFVIDGETGIHVNRNDYKEMSHQISNLINDHALRKKLAQNAYLKYAEISKETIINQWLALLF